MKHLLLQLLTASLLITSNLLGHDNELHFIQNKGQWPSQVNFRADVPGGKIWLENNKISYQFIKYPNNHANFNPSEENIVKQHVVWAEFKDINTNFSVKQNHSTDHYYNYFIGNDQSKWASNVFGFGEVIYEDIYNNIDFRIYEKYGATKYDFVIKPNGKNVVKVNYQGQEKIEINPKGELIVYTTIGQLIEEAPYAYQIKNGIKKEVKCKYKLDGDMLTFDLGSYDKKLDLIIDPVLIFATYNGSPSDNFGMTATYDQGGNLYTGGIVYGANYPTTPGAYDPVGTIPVVNPSAPASQITDVFITKYEPNGTSLVYSTYVGGGDQNGGTEAVHSLICDTLGNLHMYGTTSSSDYPVLGNAYQNTLAGGIPKSFNFNGINYVGNGGVGGGSDIFVTKLNAAGSAILGSTFIGGSNNDGLNYSISSGNYSSVAAYDSLTNNYGDQFRGEIMIDDSGYVYIASTTYSNDFPIVNGIQGTYGGLQDAIVCKFSPNLDNLIWSTYLGGVDKDAAYSVKVNHNYEVFVAGGTCSNTFPTTPTSINPVYLGGKSDGFLTKISSNGASMISSTFMGTNVYDQCYFVEVDRFGSVYTVGQTDGNYPVMNSPYSNPNSGNFIVKMDTNITSVVYSTIFGNGNLTSEFSPSAFLVDRCQNVYVSGWGGNILGSNTLTGMPITTTSITSLTGDIIPTTQGDGFNFYLTVFERDMQSQLFGIYYGGATSREHVDGGTSRFDKNGIIYQSVCAGCGNNNDFPTTTGAWSNTNNSSNCNNGVFKFDFEIIPEAEFTVDNFQGCAPLTVTFTNSSGASDSYLWDFGGGDTTSQIFNPVKVYSTPGTYNVSLLITDSICNTTDTAFQTITVSPPVTVTGGDTIATCDTSTLNINTTGNPAGIYWSSNNQFSDTLNTNPMDSSFFVTVSDTSWFYVYAGDSMCYAIDSFRVDYMGFTITANDTAICAGEQATIFSTHDSFTSLTYSWTPTSTIVSGATSSSPVVNPSTTTTYTVVAQNTNGCTATDTAQVVVSGFDPNNITVTADNDTIYGSGGTYLHVTPSSGFTYAWVPPFDLNNPNSPNPFATPDVPSVTTYIVELTENGSGCKYYKEITIYAFEVLCGEPDVFIPNAFTPNNDNENDLLFVRGRNVEEMVLKIYNRWGELVFETDDQTVGWDGTFKGELVDPAVFVYHLSVICVDGQEYFKKGNVTVIR